MLQQYVVTLRGLQGTTDDVLKRSGCDRNPSITQENFPLGPYQRRVRRAMVELIHPGRCFTLDEGIAMLGACGLRPPTHEHAIRSAEQAPLATIDEPMRLIIFPHEPWKSADGTLKVLFQVYAHKCPGLYLYDVTARFGAHCMIAGVGSLY